MTTSTDAVTDRSCWLAELGREVKCVCVSWWSGLRRFLTRLFSSLDYPTDHKLIAVGGCEPQVVSQVSSIMEQHPDVKVYHSIEFLGERGGRQRAAAEDPARGQGGRASRERAG